MRLGLGLGILMLLLAVRPAAAADWQMETSASRLEFVASIQNGPAAGVFNSFDTRLHFEPDTPAEARLEVSIDITSADMHNAELNDAVKGPLWLDFEHHPAAAFHSRSIERIDTSHFLAHGELELKGVRRPVDVPFEWQQVDDHASMRGELSIARGDFDIGGGEWASSETVSGTVIVRFKVELRKQR